MTVTAGKPPDVRATPVFFRHSPEHFFPMQGVLLREGGNPVCPFAMDNSSCQVANVPP